MKKLGFTLSEILLTLGIIGVVAALTLPSVTLEHRKRTYSTTLAAAVSDFETAMNAVIMREGVYDLLEAKAWKYVKENLEGMLCSNNTKTEAENFEQYIKFFSTPIGGDLATYYPNGKIYSFNKTETELKNNRETPFEMKNGILYAIYIDRPEDSAKDEKVMLSQGTNLYAKAADVWIDVNGAEKPNTVGRDIFYFILGADGKLYPYGGRDCFIFEPSYTDTLGYNKTAQLVENNYKMNY